MHLIKELIKSPLCNAMIICTLIIFIVVTPFNFAAATDKSKSCFPSFYQPVKIGADRLFSEFSHLIKGKKLALVTNHTGRLSNGTHLADTLFNYPYSELIVLFGMHFNIRTNDYSLPKDKSVSFLRKILIWKQVFLNILSMVYAINQHVKC